MSSGEEHRTGPHPTHAGNLFDPRVHGEEVSGAGGAREGLTKDTSGVTGSDSVTGGSTSGLTGSSTTGQDSTLTGTSSNEKQGIVPTVLSYVGLGGSNTATSDTISGRTQGDMSGAGIGSGELERESSTGGRTQGDLSGAGIGSGELDRESSGTGAGRFSDGTSTSAAADTTTNREPGIADQRSSVNQMTEAPGAGSGETASSDPAARAGSTAGGAGSMAEKTEQSADTKKSGNGSDDKPASKRENPSAIPVAGGQRLGEAHMGESKIVPDNPKPEGSEGQADKATADNTAKNAGAGGTQQGDSAGEHKEGLMGKLKDKLPGHKH